MAASGLASHKSQASGHEPRAPRSLLFLALVASACALLPPSLLPVASARGPARALATLKRPVIDYPVFVPEPCKCQEGIPCDCLLTCDNGTLSYGASQLCDGTSNCLDGSDEDMSTCNSTFDCSASNRVECPYYGKGPKVCTYNGSLCNGNPDCPGGTDENPEFCKTFTCPEYLKTCPSGAGCFYDSTQCNGVNDCLDGSDEAAGFCNDFDCSQIYQVNCPYVNGKPSGLCISPYGLCDGVSQCPGGGEEGKTFCSAFNCSTVQKNTCPGGFGCLYEYQFCDGFASCADGSDEAPEFCKSYNCSKQYTVQCPGGQQCTSEYNLCSGRKDCADGSDEGEEFCAAYNCSDTGRISCPAGPNQPPQCIYESSLCDGYADCLGGGDEDLEFCKTYTCPPGRIKCPNNENFTCTWGAFCDGADNCSPQGRNGGIVLDSADVSTQLGPVGGDTVVRFAPPPPAPAAGPAPVPVPSPDEDPAFCRAYECPEGFWKCANGLRCVPKYSLCNNYKDCEDGSDEDENLCGEIQCSDTGRVACPSGKYCMDSYCTVCQGQEYGWSLCPDGSDQWNSSCGLYNGSSCKPWGCSLAYPCYEEGEGVGGPGGIPKPLPQPGGGGAGSGVPGVYGPPAAPDAAAPAAAKLPDSFYETYAALLKKLKGKPKRKGRKHKTKTVKKVKMVRRRKKGRKGRKPRA